jgi:hypothetical protein
MDRPFRCQLTTMKTFLGVVLATILGVATGAGVAVWRIAVAPWDGDPGGMQRATPAVMPPDGPLPKVVVDQEEYEFGKIDITAEGRHEFIFANRGQGTLELAAGGTSCGCAVSEIKDDRIAPGKSGKVTVTWTANKGEGPFRQTATIETNDPTRPQVTLTVWGLITRLVRAVPPALVFGHVSAARPITGQVRLLCQLDEPLEVLGCELSDPQTAKYFEVTFEPLPADQLKEGDAGGGNSGEEGDSGEKTNADKQQRPRSGYLLTVTVKPGLPLGGFSQTILVQTGLKSVPTVKIPVAGTIVGDISIVGRGWDDQTGILTLGRVSNRQGIQRRLLLVARGPRSKEVQFTLVRTDPDLLQVDEQKLKDTTTIGSGAVTQTPLIIRIPRGSRRASYLGSQLGEILINTNHPEIPLLRIRVRFVVEG